MRATLEDADAVIELRLGNDVETTRARVWRGQVLVDWEADDHAGGCLLRPALVERLAALHAQLAGHASALEIRASGHIVAALSPAHAELVEQLGGARRVQLRARLRFPHGAYAGGEEAYVVVERGREAVLLRLTARLEVRSASPRTSRERT